MSLTTRYCRRCGQALKSGSAGHVFGCPSRKTVRVAVTTAEECASAVAATMRSGNSWKEVVQVIATRDAAIVAKTRTEAAPASDDTRFVELFALLPQCSHTENLGAVKCQRKATRYSNWQSDGGELCDEHTGGPCDSGDRPGADLPWAHIVRREDGL